MRVSKFSRGFPAKSHRTLTHLRTYVPKKEKMGHALALNDQPGTDYTTDGRDDELSEFVSIDAAISELKAGGMIVVVDN